MNRGEDARAILSALVEQSPAGFVAIDPEGTVLLINRAAAEIFDYDPKRSENVKWRELCAGKELRSFDNTPVDTEGEPLFVALRQGRRVIRRIQIVTLETGRERWVSVAAFPIHDESGAPIASVATLIDITDFKGMQDVLYHQATHDPLTGLSNRALFSASLVKALARVKRSRPGGAILALDLDNFKTVNDTMGHAAGDELLIKVADRLRNEVRETDVVSRIGGDEFNILLLDLEGEDNVSITGHIAQRICDSLAKPFIVWGQSVQITASLGVCLFPANGLDEETLLFRADAAMYQVKEQGRNGWKFWTDPAQESDNIISLENIS